MPPAHTPLLTTRQRPSRTCASAQPRTYFDTTYVLSKQGRTYMQVRPYPQNFSSARSARFCAQEPGLARLTPAAPGPTLCREPSRGGRRSSRPKRSRFRSPAVVRSRPQPPRSYLRCRSGRWWSHRRSSSRARRAPCEPQATSRASFRPPATSRRSRSGTPTPTRTARTRRTSRCEASAAAAGAVWGGGRWGRCCEHVGRHARDLLTVRAAHARARLARAYSLIAYTQSARAFRACPAEYKYYPF